MAEILLTRGCVALVDDEDYEFLSKYKWHVTIRKRTAYAVRYSGTGRKDKSSIYMHQQILDSNSTPVDHINGDGLDNRRENLRIAGYTGNTRNSRAKEGKKHSIYKGVYRFRDNGNYFSSIWLSGKSKYLGTFGNEIDAAKAYDKAARENFGEFARLNFAPTE